MLSRPGDRRWRSGGIHPPPMTIPAERLHSCGMPAAVGRVVGRSVRGRQRLTGSATRTTVVQGRLLVDHDASIPIRFDGIRSRQPDLTSPPSESVCSRVSFEPQVLLKE